MLEPPALSTDIHSRNAIVAYIRKNIDSWLEFANSTWNLDLKEHEVLFICGTTKTSRWAVAAFQGDSFGNKRGLVSGEFGPFAKAALSVHISDYMLPAHHYRHSPIPSQKRNVTSSSPLLSFSQESSDTSDSLPENQCIFVHYYKMKRRRPWSFKGPIKAAAGPHNLPPRPDDTGSTDTPVCNTDHSRSLVEATPDSACGEGYDPVRALMEYISTESDAEVAIASTLDVAPIKGLGIPLDTQFTLWALSESGHHLSQ
ncbi:hypothetical protein C8Q80DRAFT_1273631 [Daedaleopsis nitida]|nr:hypothetical protein C8Q80DRAFT_1273631 [Daedaleopsis nitida]